MVQVDVFWSYAIGAGFAVAATRQLALRTPSGWVPSTPLDVRRDLLENRWLTATLLYAALLFAPSGAWLLWAFPGWETMYAFDNPLPGWVVAAFAATNTSQALLGFLVALVLIRRGHPYAAYLQMIGGYFWMFFILVHGWDGTGYQRFFSPTRAHLDGWTWSTAALWFSSDVARTLYTMGVALLPALLLPMAWWIRAGLSLPSPAPLRSRAGRPATAGLVGVILVSALGAALSAAILTSLLVRALGWTAGLGVALIVVGIGWLRPGGFCGRLHRRLLWIQPAGRP